MSACNFIAECGKIKCILMLTVDIVTATISQHL